MARRARKDARFSFPLSARQERQRRARGRILLAWGRPILIFLIFFSISREGKKRKISSLQQLFLSLFIHTNTTRAHTHIHKNTRNKNATRRRHEHPPPPQRELSYRRRAVAKARLLRDVYHRDKVDGHVREKKCIFSGGIVVFQDGRGGGFLRELRER